MFSQPTSNNTIYFCSYVKSYFTIKSFFFLEGNAHYLKLLPVQFVKRKLLAWGYIQKCLIFSSKRLCGYNVLLFPIF